MAQEPKKKHSKGRKRTRRASITLTSSSLIKCLNCQTMTLPHQVCVSCGFYKGKTYNKKSLVEVTKA